MSPPSTEIAFYGFRPGPGGIAQVMRNLMLECARRGLKVDLLLHHDDREALELAQQRIRIRRLPSGNFFQRMSGLGSYLDRFRPRVVLTNREPANRLLAMALRRRPSEFRPRFVARVGMPVGIALERRGRLKGWLRRQTMRQSYRFADLVIANAEDVAADLQKEIQVAPEKIRILPNPTVAPEIYRLAREEVAEGENRRPLIVAVGRLARQKDYPTLLRALAQLKSEPPAQLVILGEGKERGRLEKLAAELSLSQRVYLPGYVANPFAWMARADLFVLSSAWEGSPNALIQALALGKPCVATDCPGHNRELLGQGHYGPLVPVGDDKALSRAMAGLLADPPDPERQQQAVESYQVEKAVDLYLQAIFEEE